MHKYRTAGCVQTIVYTNTELLAVYRLLYTQIHNCRLYINRLLYTQIQNCWLYTDYCIHKYTAAGCIQTIVYTNTELLAVYRLLYAQIQNC